MKRLVLAVLGAAAAAACGPSLEPDRVKTPDEIVAEQEALGAEQQKKAKDAGDYDEPETTEYEQRQQWDEEYASLELRRASRSAETCPESVTEKAPKGRASVTLVFSNDGHVKDAKVGDPYTETAVGKCLLRAMGAVIVKTYTGPEKTVEYEIDLTGAKKSGPAGGEKTEGE